MGEECNIILKQDIPILPFKVITACSPLVALHPAYKEKIENKLCDGMIVELDQTDPIGNNIENNTPTAENIYKTDLKKCSDATRRFD